MTKTIDCAGSSNVSGITYDKATSDLTVTFTGGSVYIYHKVPGRQALALESAVSKGSFLRKQIMPYYDAEKVS